MVGKVLEQVRRHLPANAGFILAVAVCAGFAGELLYRYTERLEGPVSLTFLVLVILLLRRRESEAGDGRDKRQFERPSAGMPREPVAVEGPAGGGRISERDFSLPLSLKGSAAVEVLAARTGLSSEADTDSRQGPCLEKLRAASRLAENRGDDPFSGVGSGKPALDAVSFAPGGMAAGVGALLSAKVEGKGLEPVPDSGCGRVPLSRLKGKRVLLVVHGKVHRDILVDILREADVQVRVAANGLEALQAVREEVPDCVLIDCRMPVMDGYEVTARLRVLGYSRLPIIALASGGHGSDREICLAAGINDFLAKPLDSSSLFAILGKWVAPPGPRRPQAMPPSAPAAALPVVGKGVSLPPLPPGVDVDSGLQRLHGKTALFLAALRLFRDNCGHRFQLEFQAAVAAGDWQTSERLARGLKDTAATIGANGVSVAAATLEDTLRAGNYGAVQPLSTDLVAKLRAIVDGLTHIR